MYWWKTDNDNHKKYFCQYSLHGCISDAKKGRDKVKLTKTEYQLRLPFVIYADFESVLRKQDSCESSSSNSFTTQYQQHLPCGSYINVKCSDGQYFEAPQVNIGDDAAEKFLD